jgi:hypothetical protein
VETTNDSNLFTSETKLNTNDFKRFDAGLSGGIGVDLDLVNFGVRYNYGLTKVFKEGVLRIQTLKIAYSIYMLV